MFPAATKNVYGHLLKGDKRAATSAQSPHCPKENLSWALIRKLSR